LELSYEKEIPDLSQASFVSTNKSHAIAVSRKRTLL